MGTPLPEGHIQEGLMGPLLVMPTEGSMKESTAELDLKFETKETTHSHGKRGLPEH